MSLNGNAILCYLYGNAILGNLNGKYTWSYLYGNATLGYLNGEYYPMFYLQGMLPYVTFTGNVILGNLYVEFILLTNRLP